MDFHSLSNIPWQTEIEWRNSQKDNDEIAFRYVSYFLFVNHTSPSSQFSWKKLD